MLRHTKFAAVLFHVSALCRHPMLTGFVMNALFPNPHELSVVTASTIFIHTELISCAEPGAV